MKLYGTCLSLTSLSGPIFLMALYWVTNCSGVLGTEMFPRMRDIECCNWANQASHSEGHPTILTAFCSEIACIRSWGWRDRSVGDGPA